MANRCTVFYTYNAAVVDIINQQMSKHQLVMCLVHDLVLTSLQFNIFFSARHIPDVHKSGVDYNSRFQIEQFKQISPEADDVATTFWPRVDHLVKGLPKFRSVIGLTEPLSAGMGCFQ